MGQLMLMYNNQCLGCINIKFHVEYCSKEFGLLKFLFTFALPNGRFGGVH